MTSVRRAALLLFFLPTLLSADEPASVSLRKGVYHVSARFFVPVPRAAAWAVLADYGRIADRVAAVVRSEVKERSADGVLVEQEARGRVLFFSKRLRLSLRITEEPPAAIRFVDVLGKDFRFYKGAWLLEEAPGGTMIGYEMDADPAFPLPAFIGRRVLARSAQEIVDETRRAVAAAQGAAGASSSGSSR